MAKGTYDLMIEYLRTNTWASTGKPFTERSHVEEQVLRFAVTETKTEKAQSFQAHGIN
jgi:hypothetical protein